MIKKYKNRKLYDVQNHCYISLKDVYDRYNKGQCMTIQGSTGEDITETTVFQSIVSTRQNDGEFVKMVINNGRTA